MGKIVKLRDGTTMERDDYMVVVAMDEAGAIDFLGRDNVAGVIDRGPARDQMRYHKEAHIFHVYAKDDAEAYQRDLASTKKG